MSFLPEDVRAYIARDKAPDIQDEPAGQPSTLYALFGAVTAPVVTGISRIDPRPLCRSCDGSGVDGVGEDDCPVCGGSGHSPARGLDDYSNGFMPDGEFAYADDGGFSEGGL